MTEQGLLQTIRKAKENNQKELRLSNKGLTSLPSEIGELTSLQKLDLRENRLRFLPKNFSNLINLRELELRGNDFRQFPPELLKLKNLETLQLNRNKIIELPQEIIHLENLLIIGLAGNEIFQFPKELVGLRNLEELGLSDNHLTELPEEIRSLSNLRKLYVNNNSLMTLSDEIGNLAKLRNLNIGKNRLAELPETIGKLINLVELRAFKNRLETLPDTIYKLTNLRILDLGTNYLSELSIEASKFTKLTLLDIRNNNFEIQSEILDDISNPDRIIKYYLELQKGENVSLKEGKIILIGQGNVGKTSLRDAFIHGNCKRTPDKTEGLEVRPWDLLIEKVGKVKLNIWDFGGQEIYHATHQLFFRSRCIYVLVVDIGGRTEWKTNRVGYWLNKIQTLSVKRGVTSESNNDEFIFRDEDKIPVIIVCNKIDAPKKIKPELDLDSLNDKFEKIKITNYIEVSCINGTNISLVEDEIKRLLEGIEVFKQIPQKYFEVKTKIEQLTEQYITKVEFNQLAEDDADEICDILDRIGTITIFPNNPKLKDLVVIKPRWITEGIYKILSANHVLEPNDGKAELDAIKNLLSSARYPNKDYIIEMMKDFEICFLQVFDNKEYLMFPGFFQIKRPTIRDFSTNIICFDIKFKLLIENIFIRFLVRLDKTIYRQNNYWRTGVRIIKGNCQALVEIDIENDKIHIKVEGNSLGERNELLESLKNYIYEIKDSEETYHIEIEEEKISVPQNPSVMLDYKELKDLRDQEKEKKYITELKSDFSINYLLHETEINSCQLEREIKVKASNDFFRREEENAQINNVIAENKELSAKFDNVKILTQKIELLKRKEILENLKSKIEGVAEERLKTYEAQILALLLFLFITYVAIYFIFREWIEKNFTSIEPFFLLVFPLFIGIISLIFGYFIFKEKNPLEEIEKRINDQITKRLKKRMGFIDSDYNQISSKLNSNSEKLEDAKKLLIK